MFKTTNGQDNRQLALDPIQMLAPLHPHQPHHPLLAGAHQIIPFSSTLRAASINAVAPVCAARPLNSGNTAVS